MDRRHFVLISVAPFALVACTGVRFVAARRVGGRLVVQRVDFAEGPFALLEDAALPDPVHLHRRPDGRFEAVLTRCTHQGCRVEPAGDRLACPCHGSEFTFGGDVLHGPASEPLTRFQVTIDESNVYVELGAGEVP